MSETPSYRIAWKNQHTGALGNGEYCLTKSLADASVTSLNSSHRDIKHWAECKTEPSVAPSSPVIDPVVTKVSEPIAAIKAMPNCNTEEDFVKNLFKTVQGVNYDDKCPHGLPFYACMPCSH